MGKLNRALGGLLGRQRFRALVVLSGIGTALLVIVVLVASSPAHLVTLNFLCVTNGGRPYVVRWVISNELPREVWWRIQTVGTNFPGALTLVSYDGTNYQSGVWNRMGQVTGEPSVDAYSRWDVAFSRASEAKSGERMWLVWTDQPKSKPVQRSKLDERRLQLGYFLDRHGWRRAGALVSPKSNDPHVEELVVP